MVMSNGKCAPPTAGPHECKWGDAADCLRQCDTNNDAASCGHLGEMYTSGSGIGADEVRGEIYLQRSCNANVASACLVLGNVLARPALKRHAPDEDPVWARTVKLFRQACDGGDVSGCVWLAGMYERGRGGVPVDFPRAVTLYERGCNGGEPHVCNRLGLFFEHRATSFGGGATDTVSTPLPKDDAKAAAYYKRACDGEAYAGCWYLGQMDELGVGRAPDRAAAVRLYRRGCALGEAVARVHGYPPNNSPGCADLQRLGEPR
jgi:hypothetical protein